MVKLDKELVKGSFILLIIFNIYALLNFIFQSSMARMMTAAEYGILAALFYFVYFASIFSESVQTIAAKYSSSESDKGKLKNLLKKLFRKIYFLSGIFFIVYVALSIFLSFILNIPYWLLLLTGFYIFAALFLPITRGILQGRKRFYSLGFSLVIESSLKLGLAILLVWLGWKVYGAISALLIGCFFAFIYSFFMLRDIVSSREKKADTTGIYDYSWPVFIVTFSILIFYTADLFIAQIVFDKETAGLYAIASVLSKAIFWGTQPISRAMFPLSAENKNNNLKKRDNMYFNALILLCIGIAAALAIFFFFPDFIIKIFAGRAIIESASILFYLGLATSLLSFANLNILYHVSKGKPKNSYLFFLFLIIGIALMLVFNNNLMQFSLAFLTASAIFLWASIIFLKD